MCMTTQVRTIRPVFRLAETCGSPASRSGSRQRRLWLTSNFQRTGYYSSNIFESTRNSEKPALEPLLCSLGQNHCMDQTHHKRLSGRIPPCLLVVEFCADSLQGQ